MPLFNFSIIEPASIVPSPMPTWYWLTDGYFWMQLGDKKFLEASNEEEGDTTRIANYLVDRYVQDLALVFVGIAEEVPDDLFELVCSYDLLVSYSSKVNSWLDDKIEDESIEDEVVYELNKVSEWIGDRLFSCMHLNGNPWVAFFRNKDRLIIIWDATGGHGLWTADSGELEMSYHEFVAEVVNFTEAYFEQMDKHLDLACRVKWVAPFDREELYGQRNKVREEFNNRLKFLKGDASQNTDWDLIRRILAEASK